MATCDTCGGSGMVSQGRSSDGVRFDSPCPNDKCVDGQVPDDE